MENKLPIMSHQKGIWDLASDDDVLKTSAGKKGVRQLQGSETKMNL